MTAAATDAADGITASTAAPVLGGPNVLVFRNKFLPSWPIRRGGWAQVLTLGELCDASWPTDVHFVGYLPGEPLGKTHAPADLGFDEAGKRTRKGKVEQVDDAFSASVLRRYDNEAVGHFRFTVRLWIADVDDPVAHVTGNPASDEWFELITRKLERLWEKHPKVFVFTTRGGLRIILQRETPFVIENEADKLRFRKEDYPRFARYLGRAFDIRVDPACANFSRLFRAPLVTRKVGDRWEGQSSRFMGDAADLEVL